MKISTFYELWEWWFYQIILSKHAKSNLSLTWSWPLGLCVVVLSSSDGIYSLLVHLYSAGSLCHGLCHSIRKGAGCPCTGNAGKVFPAIDFKGNRYAVMHVGIASPRWWGKRSRHSRCMLNPRCYVFGKRPMFNCVLSMKYIKFAKTINSGITAKFYWGNNHLFK